MKTMEAMKQGDFVEVVRNFGSPWLDVYIGHVGEIVGAEEGHLLVDGTDGILFERRELVKTNLEETIQELVEECLFVEN